MSAIEGQAPGRIARLGRFVGSGLKPGAVVYSVLFGAAAGVGAAGAMYIGRTFKVSMFDTDYLRQQSRLRYNEKQTVFMQEQIAENKAHYLSELAKEYDPVALRMPKGKMDMKFAF